MTPEPASDTWMTPIPVLDLARDLLGIIDLDPASSAVANERVRARRYYTREDDGLSKPWCTADGRAARIWLNPPYGKIGGVGQSGLFLDRLIGEHRAGRVWEGLILVNVATGAAWWERMWGLDVCFCARRLRFESGHSGSNSPRYDNAIGYIGTRSTRFRRVFGALGRVIDRQAEGGLG